jgi:UDP-glucose 4-epimerase
VTTILLSRSTGALARLVAQALSQRADVRLVGTDEATPDAGLFAAHYAPPPDGHALAEVLRAEQVDVVLHVELAGEESPPPPDEQRLQQNVLERMRLLGACAAAGVRRVVLRSSTLVYGAGARNSAFLDEARALVCPPQRGLLRDYVDAELFAADFARTHPDMAVVVLRCAPLVGGGVGSPLVRYLAQPAPLMLAGFNPRVQVVHPADVAEACALAALGTASGVFNLAAEHPLPLAQAIRLSGRQPVPVPAPLLKTAARLGLSALPGMWELPRAFLRYSCVADTRRARRELGWVPRHSARVCLSAQATDGRIAGVAQVGGARHQEKRLVDEVE